MKLLNLLIILVFSWSSLVANEDNNRCLRGADLQRAHKVLEWYFKKPLNCNSISLLSGGYSAASNFYIEVDGKRYVLRIYESDQAPSKVQREFYVLQEGAKIGISPRIHGIFSEDKAILMDYIPGSTISIDQAKQRVNCIRIAEALRKAHAIKKNPYARTGFQDRMEDLYVELSKSTKDQTFISEAIHLIRLGNAEIANKSIKKVNIHGDLNSRNIFITDQSVLFIDWCDTNWEDPFYDLTYFSLLHGYTFEEEQLLLSTYLQHNPTEEEKSHFSIIKKINLSSLCLTCQGVMNGLLSTFPHQTIDSLAPIQHWSYYVQSFANSKDELPAQFFFELSQCALKYAHSISMF